MVWRRHGHGTVFHLVSLQHLHLTLFKRQLETFLFDNSLSWLYILIMYRVLEAILLTVLIIIIIIFAAHPSDRTLTISRPVQPCLVGKFCACEHWWLCEWLNQSTWLGVLSHISMVTHGDSLAWTWVACSWVRDCCCADVAWCTRTQMCGVTLNNARWANEQAAWLVTRLFRLQL